MHEKAVPGVSAETVAVPHPVLLVTGESGSFTVNATVTFPVYHPFAPGAR